MSRDLGSKLSKPRAQLRVACIGECMVELAHTSENSLKAAFGGDTANTAIYLARLTEGLDVAVHYVTALGDDAYSDAMLAFWRDEGLSTDHVARLPGRLPGLYTIRTDEAGERSFTYWRGQSAARDLLKDGRSDNLSKALRSFDLLYLSGITLSILDQAQREALLSILDITRQAGGKVAFDGNFRPAGWVDHSEARDWFGSVLKLTDIALPTLDDEQALFGRIDEQAVADRLHGQGVTEVAVKLGAAGCFLSNGSGSEIIETEPVQPVVDSTAAGDSFNAGYLKGRLLAEPPAKAARIGHWLAGSVIRHRGAILPKEAMPKAAMTPDHG